MLKEQREAKGKQIWSSQQIGSDKLVATQPRMPCYKLVWFGHMEIIRRFLASSRPGIYF